MENKKDISAIEKRDTILGIVTKSLSLSSQSTQYWHLETACRVICDVDLRINLLPKKVTDKNITTLRELFHSMIVHLYMDSLLSTDNYNELRQKINYSYSLNCFYSIVDNLLSNKVV